MNSASGSQYSRSNPQQSLKSNSNNNTAARSSKHSQQSRQSSKSGVGKLSPRTRSKASSASGHSGRVPSNQQLNDSKQSKNSSGLVSFGVVTGGSQGSQMTNQRNEKPVELDFPAKPLELDYPPNEPNFEEIEMDLDARMDARTQEQYDALPDSISQIGLKEPDPDRECAEEEELVFIQSARGEFLKERDMEAYPDVTMENLNEGETMFLPVSNMTIVNDEVYDFRTRAQERHIEEDFRNITNKAKEKINQCWTEFNILNEETRRLEVRNHISDLVTRELDQFRSELKARDDEEEARLERVYGTILDKNKLPSNPPGTHTQSSFGNGTLTTVGNTKIYETHDVLRTTEPDSIDKLLNTTSSSAPRPTSQPMQSSAAHRFPVFMRPPGNDFVDDELLDLQRMNKRNAEKVSMLDGLL